MARPVQRTGADRMTEDPYLLNPACSIAEFRVYVKPELLIGRVHRPGR
jgi:hypothetical protein